MISQVPSTRRDRRRTLPRRGGCTVEFDRPGPGGGQVTARLTKISDSGIAFEFDSISEGLPEGTPLENLLVRVGACVFPGRGLIRSVAPTDGTDAEFGCLFYPATAEVEDRLTALLVGIDLFEMTDGVAE